MVMPSKCGTTFRSTRRETTSRGSNRWTGNASADDISISNHSFKSLSCFTWYHTISSLPTIQMIVPTIRPIFTLLIALAFVDLVECDTPRRKSRLPSGEVEDDMERYKKPFCIMVGAVFVSIAPLIVRFVHCLFTDPAVPIVYKEMKLRGVEMAKNRFGNLSLDRQVISINRDD